MKLSRGVEPPTNLSVLFTWCDGEVGREDDLHLRDV